MISISLIYDYHWYWKLQPNSYFPHYKQEVNESIIDWLNENKISYCVMWQASEKVTMIFDDISEAILFKLRWL